MQSIILGKTDHHQVDKYQIPMKLSTAEDSGHLPSMSANRTLAPQYFPFFALALLCLFAINANADADKSVAVGVRMQGGEVIVDVNCYVRATPQEAWAVMTDYDRATDFISKLEKSVILSRTDETFVVSQIGRMGYGPFSVRIEAVTEIQLTPFEEMRARLISGNLKKNESLTRLIPDANGTRIVYHLESIPDAWVPPIIGRALVEFETRARFGQLLDEILRRKAVAEAQR